jgi:hypothetical protein
MVSKTSDRLLIVHAAHQSKQHDIAFIEISQKMTRFLNMPDLVWLEPKRAGEGSIGCHGIIGDLHC